MSGAARADAGPASVASQPAAASSAPLAKAVTEGEATIAWRDRFFEDFSVGDTCRHRQARTVSSHDNAWFTLLTQNPAPLHLDVQFARQAGFDRVPLNSTLTLALVTGQSVADLTPHVMTNLGWSEVRLPAPAFEGDTIYSESAIVSLRASASRPNVGVVGVATTGYTQEGVVVIRFTRTVLMYRRGHGPAFVRPVPEGPGRAGQGAAR